MSKYQDIIKENSKKSHSVDYSRVIHQEIINEEDLMFFEKAIMKAKNGGNIEYDMFADEGGIDIAEILLHEVKRLRGIHE